MVDRTQSAKRKAQGARGDEVLDKVSGGQSAGDTAASSASWAYLGNLAVRSSMCFWRAAGLGENSFAVFRYSIALA